QARIAIEQSPRGGSVVTPQLDQHGLFFASTLAVTSRSAHPEPPVGCTRRLAILFRHTDSGPNRILCNAPPNGAGQRPEREQSERQVRCTGWFGVARDAQCSARYWTFPCGTRVASPTDDYSITWLA